MKKGLFHTLVAFILSASWLLPLTAHAQTAPTTMAQEATRLLYNTRNLKSSPHKTLGGYYSSNRLKGNTRLKFTPRNSNKVRLISRFPRKLGIANYDVKWTIKSLSGRKTEYTRGKVSTSTLPPGKYRVSLRIGKYTQHKIIRVRKNRNNIQSFSIPVKAGLLKVYTGTQSKTNNKSTRIYVKNRSGKVILSSKGRSIKSLLPPGKYTVEVAYGSKHHNRNVVTVRNGAIKETTVKMPRLSKVWLRAFEKGKQPLMTKHSSWIVYDASGRVVSKARTRTHRLSLLPGSYTAQLSVSGKKLEKKFSVASGRNRTISIHL